MANIVNRSPFEKNYKEFKVLLFNNQCLIEDIHLYTDYFDNGLLNDIGNLLKREKNLTEKTSSKSVILFFLILKTEFLKN